MPNRLNANININTSGDNTILSAVAGVTYKIYDLVLFNGVATAQVVVVKDAAGGNSLATLTLPLAVGQPVTITNDVVPQWLTQQAGAFVLNLSAATQVTGFVQYEQG